MSKRRYPKFSKGFQVSMAKLFEMTDVDIKRNCVVRGMPFGDLVGTDIPNRHNWLLHNLNNPIKPELLDEFDDWMEKEIEKSMLAKGAKKSEVRILCNPVFRLGYIGEKDSDGKTLTTKKVKGIKKVIKIKREKTQDGIFSGTKKAYTYELQKSGLSKEEVIKKVMAKFTEASEKSIGIWFNKSKKGK